MVGPESICWVERAANMADTITINASLDYLLCNACGTQYPVTGDKDECKICDVCIPMSLPRTTIGTDPQQDPRQFVPPEGQTFTTLRKLQALSYQNVWWQDTIEPRIWSVRTEPQFAIGHRAELIQTSAGNILMDLIPYLDQPTIDKIQSLGGLKAIIISHPHYYCTWADWSRTFNCPVYVGLPDKEWLERVDTEGADLRFLTDTYTPIKLDGRDTGAMAVIAGGHFPGSLLMLWEKSLFIADTIFTVPSATNPVPGKPGVISFSFFWSIPNRIPLHPDDILMIWNKVKDLDFDKCYGAFKGMDVYTMENEKERATGGVKGRLLESCKIFTRASGWTQHGILEATL